MQTLVVKTKNVAKRAWAATKDFFNMKDWMLLLRKVPGVALSLITVSTVLMNILANKSIIELPWLLQDAGVVVSWVGFLVGDLLTKNFGAKNGIRVQISCLLLSLFISVLLYCVSVIPGTWSSEYAADGSIIEGVGEAIDAVMSNVWYVILGSALASACGIVVNNISQEAILKPLESKKGNKYWVYLIAAAVSSMLGQFVDNVVFASVVSVNFFGWTWEQVLVCSTCGMIFECIIEMCFTPLTFRISKSWDRHHIGLQWMYEGEVAEPAVEAASAGDAPAEIADQTADDVAVSAVEDVADTTSEKEAE